MDLQGDLVTGDASGVGRVDGPVYAPAVGAGGDLPVEIGGDGLRQLVR